jgi:hypothetical protein
LVHLIGCFFSHIGQPDRVGLHDPPLQVYPFTNPKN